MADNVPELVSARPLAEGEPLWRRLLNEAIRNAGPRGKAAVAERLGVSRPYVSRVIAGDYDPVPSQFVQRVIDRLHVIDACPATGLPQPRSECVRIGRGAAPTHNPLAMRIWATCQRCPHKPEGKS